MNMPMLDCQTDLSFIRVATLILAFFMIFVMPAIYIIGMRIIHRKDKR